MTPSYEASGLYSVHGVSGEAPKHKSPGKPSGEWVQSESVRAALRGAESRGSNGSPITYLLITEESAYGRKTRRRVNNGLTATDVFRAGHVVRRAEILRGRSAAYFHRAGMSAKLMVLQPTRLPPQLLNDEAAKLDFCRRVESPSLEKEKLPRTKEQGVPRLGRIDCGNVLRSCFPTYAPRWIGLSSRRRQLTR